MNAGIYYFSKNIFKENILNFKSIENELIPYLIKKKKVSGFFSKDFFIDIGTYKNLKIAELLIDKGYKSIDIQDTETTFKVKINSLT
jgi:NDP-sugar pyrophosphorylase family protein